MATIRKRVEVGTVRRTSIKPRRQSVGKIGWMPRGIGHFADRDCALGTLHDEGAVDKRNLIDRRLKKVCSDQPTFLDQLFNGHHKSGAAEMHRTRAAMAVTAWQKVRVALVEVECGNRQSEQVGRDLRIGGFMSLTVGLRPESQAPRAGSFA